MSRKRIQPLLLMLTFLLLAGCGKALPANSAAAVSEPTAFAVMLADATVPGPDHVAEDRALARGADEMGVPKPATIRYLSPDDQEPKALVADLTAFEKVYWSLDYRTITGHELEPFFSFQFLTSWQESGTARAVRTLFEEDELAYRFDGVTVKSTVFNQNLTRARVAVILSVTQTHSNKASNLVGKSQVSPITLTMAKEDGKWKVAALEADE